MDETAGLRIGFVGLATGPAIRVARTVGGTAKAADAGRAGGAGRPPRI